ncbi:hypothetical protein [Azohydromonas australica]|nr:hypothetical protein [Azohydromonas australica]
MRRWLVLAGLLVLVGLQLRRRRGRGPVPDAGDVAPDGTTLERYAG